jgi:hypothetical protein
VLTPSFCSLFLWLVPYYGTGVQLFDWTQKGSRSQEGARAGPFLDDDSLSCESGVDDLIAELGKRAVGKLVRGDVQSALDFGFIIAFLVGGVIGSPEEGAAGGGKVEGGGNMITIVTSPFSREKLISNIDVNLKSVLRLHLVASLRANLKLLSASRRGMR